MKKMVCEMCGGNDLLKDEGVLICQSCGTKYSVEEARRMMVEIDGPVDVSGSTVKVDNSARLDNLYKIARRARDDGNVDQAYRKYEELLVEDPDNWEPNFFTAYYSTINTLNNDSPGGSVRVSGNRVSLEHGKYRSGLGSAIKTLANCLDSVYGLIENIQDCDEQEVASNTVGNRILRISEQLNDLIENERVRMVKEIHNYYQQTEGGFMQTGKMYKENEKTAEYYRQINEDLCDFTLKRVTRLAEIIAKRREEETKRRFDEYWKTHKEEKAALEAEKKSLLETVANIIKEIPLIPQKTEGYNEMLELKRNVENLTAEKNAIASTPEIVERSQKIEQLTAEKQTLGFFDSKGKKPIKEQIASLEKEIASIQKSKNAVIQGKIDTANNAISPIQSRIEQNIKAAYSNISNNQARIEAIDRKLTTPGAELEELEDIEHMNDAEEYIEEQPQIYDEQELCAFCGGEIACLGFWKVCKACGEPNN